MMHPPKTLKRRTAQLRTYLMRHSPMVPRIELAIPASMLWTLLHHTAKSRDCDEQTRAVCASAIPDLQLATAEPFMGQGIPPGVAGDEASMATLAAVLALDIPDGGRSGSTLILAAVFWLQDMLARDVLVLTEGTAFARAVDALTDALTTGWDAVAPMEKSARKLAKGIGARLAAFGLYRDGPSQPLPAE
jgi:hypothetical protein